MLNIEKLPPKLVLSTQVVAALETALGSTENAWNLHGHILLALMQEIGENVEAEAARQISEKSEE
jgi:hypothetical protein